MQTKLKRGDEVRIVDIHPGDPHYSKKDLLFSNKAFIFAPPNPKWIRNKHMKEWLSVALIINDEVYWFWGIKIETPEPEENETIKDKDYDTI